MSAHTPGPWKVVSESTAKELDLFEIADVSHLRVICDGNTNGYDVAGSPEADARLIAAAPKLLERLHRLEVSANTVAYCYDKRPENFAAALTDLQDAAEAARAAVAEATGAKP